MEDAAGGAGLLFFCNPNNPTATVHGKAAVAAGVTADLIDRVSAVDLVKAAALALGGKGGGGRPDMAQAGGADASKADEAIKAAEAVIGG